MRLSVLWLSFALFMLLGGCAAEAEPQCHGRFRADASLSVAQRNALARAAGNWNEFAGRDAVVIEDEAACSIRAVSSSLEYDDIAAKAGQFSGAWSPKDASIVLATERLECGEATDECIEAVLMHEMGHAMGLDHIDAPGSVMAIEGGLTTSFTAADKAECLRAGVCLR